MRGLPALVAGCALALLTLGSTEAEDVGAAGPPSEIPLERTAQRLGLAVSRDAPITITSDELEVTRDENGSEQVVFRRNVTVVQGDMRLRCDWLQAEYSGGAGGTPQRIVARGAVRMMQDDSEIRCTEAVFTNDACQAVCTSESGPAELRRGDNVIKGDRIVFDLCTGYLKVRGSARVGVKPEADGP